MTTTKTKPRVTSLAPQFLVDDLARSITYYQKLGFTFGEPWDGFYAIGQLDGLELHSGGHRRARRRALSESAPAGDIISRHASPLAEHARPVLPRQPRRLPSRRAVVQR